MYTSVDPAIFANGNKLWHNLERLSNANGGGIGKWIMREPRNCTPDQKKREKKERKRRMGEKENKSRINK